MIYSHWQDGLVAKEFRDELGELGKDVVVERPRTERELRRLGHEGIDDLRVTVTLVDGAIGGKEVQVLLPLRVVDERPLAPGDDDGERVVVVGGVRVFVLDGPCGRVDARFLRDRGRHPFFTYLTDGLGVSKDGTERERAREKRGKTKKGRRRE